MVGGQPSTVGLRMREYAGGISMFTLVGVDASVTVDGRTVTIKRASAGGDEQPITLTADSINGAAVWTGLLTGQFSVHYRDGSAANTFQSVQFRVADKEWWDAMASAVMDVVGRSTRGRSTDKTQVDAPPAAPPSFSNWLNRTVGFDAQQKRNQGQ